MLLTIYAEIEGQKKKWRELTRRQKEKEQYKHLKPVAHFVEHVQQKLSFEKFTVYHYIAIAENWEEFKLWECKTLREALDRMGRLKQKSATVETRIQLEEKHQNDLDLLSSNPESQIVDADLVPKVEFEEQSVELVKVARVARAWYWGLIHNPKKKPSRTSRGLVIYLLFYIDGLSLSG